MTAPAPDSGQGGRAGPGSPPEARSERLYWKSVARGFFIVSLVIAVAGAWVYRTARESVAHAVTHNLDVIAGLKAIHLDHWVDEEQYDVWNEIRAAFERPEFAGALQTWLQGGGRDDALRTRLIDDLHQISQAHGYLEINLRSALDGSVLLASDRNIETPDLREIALDRIRSKAPVLGDFHVGDTDGVRKLRFSFLNALSVGGRPQDRVVVEVMLDASGAMLPAIQQWPGWNVSASTRLVRREGDKLVVLDSQPDVSGALPLGFSTAALADSTLAAEALRIGSGALDGKDLDGQPVFAHAHPVPHTPWTLLAEVRKEDAFASLNTIAAITAAVAVLLMLSASWWLRQQSRNTIARVRSEAERRLLATRINFLAKYANDCIILFDATGRIMEVNDRCPRTYGYTQDELLRMNLADLHSEGSRPGVPERLRQIPEAGLIEESEHQRKDGRAFDVEMSTSLIDIDGRPCYQAIIRDISERKKHQIEREAQMQLLNRLTHRLVNVQEEERRHLSAELHDQVGANLATVNLNLRRIGRMLQAPDSRRLEGALAETGSLLAETISSIRYYCADLRPAVLDYSGLAPALEELVQRFGRHSDIHAVFRQHDMEQRLAPQTESMLFRIAQEALTNCAKHSNASTVEVAISRRACTVVLEVADDGAGFDPAQLGVHQVGMGLLTMRERAAMTGGSLSVISSPGKGTRIKVVTEIREDAAGEALELPGRSVG
jgi:PAS domain S-box-containing protein